MSTNDPNEGLHHSTIKEFERQRLLNSRDDHAHARIDALQKELAGLMAMAIGRRDDTHEQRKESILWAFAEADKEVAKELGLDP